MIVTIGGTKGGSGKTTTAVNLAVYAAMDNKKVLLVDADPQASSMAWRQIRADIEEEKEIAKITCVALSKGTIQSDLPELAKGYDLTVVDVGGRDSRVLRSAMVISDLFITPAAPAAYDLWALEDTIEIIKEARSYGFAVDAYLLLNQVLTQKTILEQEAQEIITDLQKDITLLKSILHARQDFKTSSARGLGCCEFNSKSAAADECNVFYNEIDALLKQIAKNK